MTIKKGDSPEKNGVLNKFIAKGGEGQRGLLLAVNKEGDTGVMLATNSSLDKRGVVWGLMYLVREDDPNSYPKQVRKIDRIPLGYEMLWEET